MSKYDDLVKKLKEIFQIDKPELDFGVYRILNARAVEINDYLENRLKAKVQASLAVAGAANSEHIQKELIEAEKNAASLGVSPDNVPKVLELRQKLAEYSVGTSEHENAVFTHLLTFFSRYYDSGDFISQRRYKGDTYAIPYAGEEVMLHWANKDQYYTKSGENFSNYAFKLEDGRAVRFRLIAADTAKDNRKDNDKERRFVLIEPHTRTLTDDEGDEYEEALQPVEEVDGELVVRFEYKAMAKGSKQYDQISKAVTAVLADENVKTKWLDLSKREPTESNPQRTLLEKCLVNYTSKNTADYFIHKDLGRFLRGELDFYIKNEVMHLDDVQNAEKFADIEKNLRLIQTLRSIALDLVTFLAQLEDFQKKLWLKKKFVVATHYCITLDRIPESLYAAIAANEQQWEQWQALGLLDGDKTDLFKQAQAGSVDYLKAHQFLMADTALFNTEFKSSLLAAVDNLDECIDGVMVQGDNFQALNLLQERYREQVKCVYIDPPYNIGGTGDGTFAYKDDFRHSSWMSMVFDRINLASNMLSQDGFHFTSIGKDEEGNLRLCLDSIFGQDSIPFLWKSRAKPTNAGEAKYRPQIVGEFIFLNSKRSSGEFIPITSGLDRKYPKRDGLGEYRTETILTSNLGRYQRETMRFEVAGYTPPAEKRWKAGDDEIESMYKNKRIDFNEQGEPFKKTYRDDDDDSHIPFWSFIPEELVGTAENGKSDLNHIVGTGHGIDSVKPKELVEFLTSPTTNKTAICLDYFAGSGTTAHAVMSLNRRDNGNRKYILVEQGEYFDTVTKPRIQKVVYSAEWRDAKATAPQTGISHAFKVLKLESYEDTLNNLQLRRSEKQQDMVNSLPQSAQDDYLLRYMLDIESRGSLLSVEQFNQPFDCKLKVAVDSAGAYEERSIDMVETFNYLIGLRVKHIDMQRAQGFVAVTGWLPTGEKTLVLWRDVAQVDYVALNKLCDKLAINPADSEFEIVYVNGDHNIPAVFTSTEAEGGITKTLKLRQIEPEFLSRMFAVDNV